MKKLYFIVGSQDLYGEETLKKAETNIKEISDFLNSHLSGGFFVESKPIVKDSYEAERLSMQANADEDCVGVIIWMHTFSPAKMWIKALQALRKPLLHLHTQFNDKIPYDTIDMDFMNLNQSAHGDREFGFICTRLGIRREIVTGHYKNSVVLKKIQKFAEVANAINFGRKLKVMTFGNNMRNVAVTDGDRVESEIRYGWNVNYYGIGDLCDIANSITEDDISLKMDEYYSKYSMDTENLNAVCEQAKYEIALEKIMKREGANAFTDTFEDLHGLNQLPGLAAQNLMAKGFGFGPEGDYKIAALGAVLFEMAKNRDGATGFIENYTYDLTEGEELELAAHMLEISPVFAKNKPSVQVHPLSIGNKSDPARLVFDGISGEGIAVCMVDMGNRFRLICADISLVTPPCDTPNLPVAKVMWKVKPDFETGVSAWIYAGGAHHAIISTALTVDDIRLFAKLTDTELVVINENTDLASFEQELSVK